MDVVKALRSLTFASAALVTLANCGSAGNSSQGVGVSAENASCSSTAVPHQFVVHWKDGHTSVEQSQDVASLKREVLEPNKKDIAYVHRDHFVSTPRKVASNVVVPMTTTSATLANWGQNDVDATEAWAMANGSGVVVAVVDTGVDITHPQLKDQLAINAADIPANGLDDDKNGYVDDTYGYDFWGKTGAITDGTEGHGTHVSGIILAEHTGLSTSVNGMAPGAKLLALRFMDPEGSGLVSDAVPAIIYAAARGAKVINASWGGSACDLGLQNAIKNLEAQNILFVSASGNGDNNNVGFNLDTEGVWPASYGLPAQISVGAVMQTQYNGDLLDVMAGFSNYSKALVGLLAPGAQIRSTFPLKGATCDGGESDGYCYKDGTSMATPFVSGVAALLYSFRPKATVAQVKAALIAGVTPGQFPVISGGKLNAKKALDALALTVGQ